MYFKTTPSKIFFLTNLKYQLLKIIILRIHVVVVQILIKEQIMLHVRLIPTQIDQHIE